MEPNKNDPHILPVSIAGATDATDQKMQKNRPTAQEGKQIAAAMRKGRQYATVTS